MMIDTHARIKEMMDLGIPEKQAEIFVARFAFKEELNHLDNRVVTKIDLTEAESKINHQLITLESKIQGDIANLKYDMLKWMFGFFVSTAAINLTAIAFAVRFLLK